MTPVSPVVPGADLPEIVFAKNQPEYLPLPAHRTDDGRVYTRWRLTWRERLRVLLGGNLWLMVMTFNRPLQPVMIEAQAPDVVLSGAAR